MDMIEVAIRQQFEEVFDWRQFIAEYYSEADNPVEALWHLRQNLQYQEVLFMGTEETENY